MANDYRPHRRLRRLATYALIFGVLMGTPFVGATSGSAGHAPAPGHARLAAGQDNEPTLPEAHRSLLPSTCWIVNQPLGATGTGWIIDARRRLIITNEHVVEGTDSVFVYFPVEEGGRVVREEQRYLKEVK